MKINHIGYAVNNINKAIEKFRNLGYEMETSIIPDEVRNLNICFMRSGDYRIELVSTLDESKKSPIDDYICAVGDIPYHICYECENIHLKIETLRLQRYMVVNEPQEAIALENKEVAFLMCKNVGLIELVEIKDQIE